MRSGHTTICSHWQKDSNEWWLELIEIENGTKIMRWTAIVKLKWEYKGIWDLMNLRNFNDKWRQCEFRYNYIFKTRCCIS